MVVEYAVTSSTEETGSKIDFDLISSIYEKLCGFQHIPSLDMIYNQYNMILESRLAELRANIYPDDIYDGNPNRPYKKQILPDYVIADLQSYIQMEPVEISDIEKCLNFYNLFYLRTNGEYLNPIILEVW